MEVYLIFVICAVVFTIPGISCQNCSLGWFGSSCTEACRCKPPACSSVDGRCNSGTCADGWTDPPLCQRICSSGTFGAGCTGTCHCNLPGCSNTNGRCLGDHATCADGWTGFPFCQTPANGQTSKPDATTATRTNKPVSSPFLATTKLTAKTDATPTTTTNCPPGSFGRTTCTACHCKPPECSSVDGRCSSGTCADGWTGSPLCQTRCPSGTFGAGCNGTCHCNPPGCVNTNGRCLGDGATCADGWTGFPFCQKPVTDMTKQTVEPDATQVTSTVKSPITDASSGIFAAATTAEPPGNGILGPILGSVLGVLVIAAIVGAIIFRRSRRNNAEDVEQRRAGETTPIIPAGKRKRKTKHYENAALNAESLSRETGMSELMKEVYTSSRNSAALEEEFENIPKAVDSPTTIAYLPEHENKCRYRGLVPYDHSRVVLEPRDSDPTSDFINASYIDGFTKKREYVAVQGATVIIINDFWRMIWQLNSDIIVMLTKLQEGNKRKCDQYWPKEGSVAYGHITVELLAEHNFDDFVVRTLEIRADGKVRTIKQFHFTRWGDHDAPDNTTGIISLLNRIHEARDDSKGPLVVHCSAGVGRTGTFIALDILLKQAKAGGKVDLPKCIYNIRRQRAYMIQTVGQYVFLRRALCDAWVCGDSILTPQELLLKYDAMMLPSEGNRKSIIQQEFEGLKSLQKKTTKLDYTVALHANNDGKSRDPENLALDSARIFLSTNVPERTDFINAVYLPGYKNKLAYISTQLPLPGTVVDFWRLVYEQKSSTIIMLDSDGGSSDTVYWPNDDEKLNVDPLEIQHQGNIQGDIFLRQFGVSSSGDLGTGNQPQQVVRQFCVDFWPEGQAVPNSSQNVLKLIKMVLEWQRQHQNRPIIVHCRNGVEKTVLLCACFSIIEKLMSEHIVSVMFTAKNMREHRPGGITNLDQYRFCYEVVKTYILEFETGEYSNFL